MLERRIEGLRAQVRRAVVRGDRERARELRRELREAEHAWEDALARVEDTVASRAASSGMRAPSLAGLQAGRAAAPEAALPGGPGAARPAERLLPLREQAHQALTLLGVPAALRMISTVHEAFFAGTIAGARLTSLRRDEERSFRSAPFARPYYLCAALTADLLAPARGLLAVSTWPMERRVIGPLSPRVDYLSAAVAVAESIQRIPAPSPVASRLLWRFAVNIPGVPVSAGPVDPGAVADAARAELAVHADADAATRRAAAARARHQLDDAGQLFGSRLRAVPDAAAGA